MIFNLNEKDGILIARFIDVKRFTLANTEGVKLELKPLLCKNNTKLIIDFGNIEFIDSSAIGCVISLVKTAKSAGAKIKLCNLSKDVEDVFELLHLQMILEIEKDADTCIRIFQNSK